MMKKIVLFLVVFACAQLVTAQEITFGVKGGGNFSSQIIREKYSSQTAYGYVPGFQVGGFMKMTLLNNLFIQPELLYSLQGFRYEVIFFTETLDENVHKVKRMESTIVLPLILKYYPVTRFYVEFGPQLDYLFNTRFSSKELETESKSESDFNFGLNAGIGYDFNDSLGLGFRYNYGLNRADKSLPVKANNSVFALGLEYRFN